MHVDLLLKSGQVFNSYFKEFRQAAVAVLNGRIIYVGTEACDQLTAKHVVDLTGKYLIPGLIDCHMHIESSMATPAAFAAEVVKNGVTTLIAEPHEIANVFGLAGITAMLADAQGCPVDIRLAIPSSVPSTNAALETSGGEIGQKEVAALLHRPETICLGEVMNCGELLSGLSGKTQDLIRQVKLYNSALPIEGHCPAFLGLDLARIVAAGVDSDHTEQTVERLKQRVAAGVFIELQDKTLRPEIIAYLKKHNLFERFALVTDDTMPDKLVQRGHLNYLIKKAIHLGLTPEEAIYAATYTPAQRMGLKQLGSIAPGKFADFVVLDSPTIFTIEQTFKAGREVYNRKKHTATVLPQKGFPEAFYHSVHCRLCQPEDFTLRTKQKDGYVTCRILLVKDGTTFVEEDFAQLPVRNYEIQWEQSPYALAMVIERHGKNGNRGVALVGGAVLKKGAAATTYAHDHHNLLIVGQTRLAMCCAANQVISSQGGYAVADTEKLLAFAPLPIAGILSSEAMPVLAEKIGKVVSELRNLGYAHTNILMSLSTLALPVSPAFKVTDRGIVDVQQQKIVPLVLKEE